MVCNKHHPGSFAIGNDYVCFQSIFPSRNPKHDYWTLIAISAFVSIVYFKSWKYIIPVYIVLFILIEVAYSSGIPIWNERERVRNIYNLGYVFLPDEGKYMQSADLSEGYFKCDYENTTSHAKQI